MDLGVEEVCLPDGRELRLEVVRHPGGAAVVALDDNQRMVLLRQYRHAAGGWIDEIPAGKLEGGETPLATAQRELEEEAGLRADEWRPLGAVLMTPGFCDEVIHLFLATGLTAVPPHPGRHELLEVRWVALADAAVRAEGGEIRDAKTIAGILRARAGVREGSR